MDILYVLISLAQLGDPNAMGIPAQEFTAVSFTNILNVVYMIAGIIAVVSAIIGGILLATSSGDPGKAARGRNTILYSVMGLVVVAAAFTITSFITGRL